MLELLHTPGFQITLVLSLTLVVFIALIREKVPSDVVALLAMGALMLAGVLSTSDALAVFANPAPITVAAMFVLSASLERTGMLDGAGRALTQLAERGSPILAIMLLMLGVIILSAFVNNTPLVVILIPVVLRLAKSTGIAPSKLLIPLSFAAILGGTTTLIGTSTNIIVDGVAQAGGLAPFGIFEITAAGAVMALVGAVYLTVAVPFLLPQRDTLSAMLPDGSERRFLAQILVPMNSVLVGCRLNETGLTAAKGFTIIDVFRNGVSLRGDLATVVLEVGDIIALRSPVAEMLSLKQQGDVAIGAQGLHGTTFEPVATKETRLMEGVIGPASRLIGKRQRGHGLARLYGVYVLAIHRRGENMSGHVDDFRFEIGDTVLVEGGAQGLRQLFEEGTLSNLTETTHRPFRRDKAPIALIATAAVVVLSALNVLPIAALALIAAGLVIALGCIDHQEAYASIRWDILMLIFGMLALGTAMEQTGAAAMIVGGVEGVIGHWGPLAVLAALYLITSILTEMMSNNATAILLTPIAIGLGHQLGIDPRPFVVAVMFAASASFATPIGYQTNTLVYTAGGYRFMDFVRVGLPLNIILFVVAMLVIPHFWPLSAPDV